MSEHGKVTLDFDALERVGGIEFTSEQRDYLLGAVTFLRMEAIEPLSYVSSKEQHRKFSAGIAAGKRFLEFLDFFIKLGSRECFRAELWGNEEVREPLVLGVAAVMKHQRQLAGMLPVLCKFKKNWRGKSGPKTGYFRIFVYLTDRICQDAGAKGPYYDDFTGQYRGGVLNVFEEILKQNRYTFISQGALAKAILRARRASRHNS